MHFAILINRKRALIALAHSLVFLGIAFHGFVSPKPAAVLQGPGVTASVVSVAIYFTVASILTGLVSLSHCIRERLYFALCACGATSASCGPSSETPRYPPPNTYAQSC